MDSIIYIDERNKVLELSRLFLDVDWEEAGKRFTKSYWQVQYHLENALSWSFRLGSNLMEEVVACLLGGYGLKAELGLLAFHRMKNLRLIHKGVALSEVEKAILRPFKVNGKDVHYRFPHQKAKYIYYFLQRTDLDDLEKLCGLDLRNKLMDIKGIGPKTASWIARNYKDCDDVAIVDVHIYRAGRIAGFVDPKWNMRKDYFKIEDSFLDFCHSINASPAKMDSIIWNQMKRSNRRAIEMLNV